MLVEKEVIRNNLIAISVTSVENSNAIFASSKAAPDMNATLDRNSWAKNAISAMPKLETI